MEEPALVWRGRKGVDVATSGGRGKRRVNIPEDFLPRGRWLKEKNKVPPEKNPVEEACGET